MKKFWKKIVSAAVVTMSLSMAGCSCGESNIEVVLSYGGKMSSQSFEIEKNSVFEKPANPTLEGYVFEGWYADSEYKTKFDFSKSLSSSTLIYAKFSQLSNITKPNTTLATDGYVLYILNEKSHYLVGESLTLKLIVAQSHNFSIPSLIVNGEAIEAATFFEGDEGYEFTYNLADLQPVTEISVDGVSINTYHIDLPTITGAVITPCEGFIADSVEYGSSFKFTIECVDGYEKESVKVKLNGEEIHSYNGIYEIKNVVDDNNILEVSGIKKQRLNISYYENKNNLPVVSNTLSTSNFTITATQLNSIEYGEDFVFDLEVTNPKYFLSDLCDNKDAIEVRVSGNKVEYSIEKVREQIYELKIEGKYIVSNIEVRVLSELFELNTYTVNIADTNLNSNGYRLKFIKYSFEGQETLINSDDRSIKVKYGSKLFVNIEYDVDNYNAQNLKLSFGGYSFNYNNKEISFDIYQDGEIKVTGLELNHNTVSLPKIDGAVIQGINGYTNKAYCKNIDNLLANTFEFAIEIKEGYEKKSDFAVSYVKDGKTIDLQGNNDKYIITDIDEDISISVVGIGKKIYSIGLPMNSELECVNDIDFVDATATGSVKHGNSVIIKVEFKEGYNNSFNNILLLVNNAHVSVNKIEGNVIYYNLSNITGNITPEDFKMTGFAKNRYTISIPQQRLNYKLLNSDLQEVSLNYRLEYGKEVYLIVSKDAAYTKADYVVLINGEEYVPENDIIYIQSVTSNIEIEISGIDEVNTYSVNFYESDKETLLSSATYTHGNQIKVPNNTEEKQYYQFTGWDIFDANGAFVRFEEFSKDLNMYADADVNIVAHFDAVKFDVIYDFGSGYINEHIDNTLNPEYFTCESFENGNIVFDSSKYELDGYTFDYFVLAEDIQTLNGTILAGTRMDEIKPEMLCDIKLTAVWIITVGENANYTNLSDAVRNAVENDTIKIVDKYLYETKSVSINKSLNIIGVEDRTSIYSDALAPGTQINGYLSYLSIGNTNKVINVSLSNIYLEYECPTTTYDAVCVDAYNCNLSLNNMLIKSNSNSLNYVGSGDIYNQDGVLISSRTSLAVTNCELDVKNNENYQREYAVKVMALGEGVVVNLKNTKISHLATIDGFKGIWIAKEYKRYQSTEDEVKVNTYGLTLDIDGVTFVANSYSGDEKSAIYSQINSVLNVRNTTLSNIANSNNVRAWTNFVLIDHKTNLTSSTEVNSNIMAADISKYDYLYSEDSGNVFNAVNIVKIKYYDIMLGGDISIYNTILDGIVDEWIEFYGGNTISYIHAYDKLKYKPRSSNTDIIVNTEISVAENKVIDCGKYNIIFNNKLTNTGNINCADFATNSVFENYGVVSTTYLTIEKDSSTTNSGSIASKYFNIDGVFTNASDGNIETSSSITIYSSTITNNGKIKASSIDLSAPCNFTNNGDIEVTGSFSLNMPYGSTITIDENVVLNNYGMLKANYIYNGGKINNYELFVEEEMQANITTKILSNYGVLIIEGKVCVEDSYYDSEIASLTICEQAVLDLSNVKNFDGVKAGTFNNNGTIKSPEAIPEE